jgi:glycine cleavage system H protein
MLRFTQDHEWLLIDNDLATVGVTDYAQERLGDLVFVDVPKPGAKVQAGGAAAVVESVKAASDVYAPIDGEVVEANGELAANPALVNSDPMGKGWLFRLKITNPSQIETLMDEAAYQALLANV